MYLLDWEGSRAERIDVQCGLSGAVASSMVVSNFSGGRYLFWDLAGPARLTITPLTGNAVLSALFFDPPGTVLEPRFANGVFSVSFPTVAGRTYILEYNSAPRSGSWVPLVGVTGNGGQMRMDDYAVGATQRFYRVREE